jgi:hypothetical protein
MADDKDRLTRTLEYVQLLKDRAEGKCLCEQCQTHHPVARNNLPELSMTRHDATYKLRPRTLDQLQDDVSALYVAGANGTERIEIHYGIELSVPEGGQLLPQRPPTMLVSEYNRQMRLMILIMGGVGLVAITFLVLFIVSVAS